jgi:hypothetical protein
MKESMSKCVEESMMKLLENIKNAKPKSVGWISDENDEDDDDDEMVEVEKVLFLEDRSRVDKMMVDTACPNSMTSSDTLESYLKANNILLESLDVEECSKMFRFGPSKIYESKRLVTLLVTIQMEGSAFKKVYMKMYIIECSNLPLLCGKNTLEDWNIEMTMKDGHLHFKDDNESTFCMKDKDHYLLALYQLKNWNLDDMVYLIKEDDEVRTFEKIKKIHNATNHNGVRNLLHAFRNAGLLTDDVRQNIEDVVSTCKVCQKYGKSLGTLKVSLMKSMDFN